MIPTIQKARKAIISTSFESPTNNSHLDGPWGGLGEHATAKESSPLDDGGTTSNTTMTALDMEGRGAGEFHYP